jgi:hypothetical protein
MLLLYFLYTVPCGDLGSIILGGVLIRIIAAGSLNMLTGYIRLSPKYSG